jgi:hypothetical protein
MKILVDQVIKEPDDVSQLSSPGGGASPGVFLVLPGEPSAAGPSPSMQNLLYKDVSSFV